MSIQYDTSVQQAKGYGAAAAIGGLIFYIPAPNIINGIGFLVLLVTGPIFLFHGAVALALGLPPAASRFFQLTMAVVTPLVLSLVFVPSHGPIPWEAGADQVWVPLALILGLIGMGVGKSAYGHSASLITFPVGAAILFVLSWMGRGSHPTNQPEGYFFIQYAIEFSAFYLGAAFGFFRAKASRVAGEGHVRSLISAGEKAERLLNEYGAVLEQTSRSEYAFGAPESLLPKSKDKIKGAIAAYLLYLYASQSLDDTKLEVLKAGYMQLATFLDDKDANRAISAKTAFDSGDPERIVAPDVEQATERFSKSAEECASLGAEFDAIFDAIVKRFGTGKD